MGWGGGGRLGRGHSSQLHDAFRTAALRGRARLQEGLVTARQTACALQQGCSKRTDGQHRATNSHPSQPQHHQSLNLRSPRTWPCGAAAASSRSRRILRRAAPDMGLLRIRSAFCTARNFEKRGLIVKSVDSYKKKKRGLRGWRRCGCRGMQVSATAALR